MASLLDAGGLHAWDTWLDEGIQQMKESNLLRSLRPITIQPLKDLESPFNSQNSLNSSANIVAQISNSSDEDNLDRNGELDEVDLLLNSLKFYKERGPWDYSAVNVKVNGATMEAWQNDVHSTGSDTVTDSKSFERPLKLFSGNDYLGLSSHPSVRYMSAYASLKYGMGPRSSPLVCGYTNFHRKLETILAKLKGTEECILTPTGFAANLAVISALTISHNYSIKNSNSEYITSELDTVTIFSDELNHASIIDGLKIASKNKNVVVNVYKHNDMIDLENQLKKCESSRKIVITDSLFSMDGDFACINQLSHLRSVYKFLWIIDEAHASLVCGENGGGAAELFGAKSDVDIQVGTLSKAIASQGGFIACSKIFKQFIISKGRSFIYSTSLPLPVIFSSIAAIRIAKVEKWRQLELWNNIHLFSKVLNLKFHSPIIPIMIGSSKRALDLSKILLNYGFHVPAIRPPTVPSNSSRLRIALSASHTSDDILSLARSLLSAWEEEASASLPSLSIKLSDENSEKNINEDSDDDESFPDGTHFKPGLNSKL